VHEIQRTMSSMRRLMDQGTLGAEGLGCAKGRRSPRFGLAPVVPEKPTSVFGRDSNIQI
jgi:hypothetical protein